MKLLYHQLHQHLKQKLAPIYLVSGDELALQAECYEAIQTGAHQQGFQERLRIDIQNPSDWEEFIVASANLSLFATQRLIEIHSTTQLPGNIGSKILQRYLLTPPDDTLVILLMGKLEARATQSTWYQAIDKMGVILTLSSLNEMQFQTWLKQRLEAVNLTLQPQALSLFANYCSGNLVAAKQEIEKLSLLFKGQHLTVAEIKTAVVDQAQYDVFQLIDTILKQQFELFFKIFDYLQTCNTPPAIVLWALTRELRILAQISFGLTQGKSFQHLSQNFKLWTQRQTLIKQAVARQPYLYWQQLIQYAQVVDRLIKGVEEGDPWQGLWNLCLGMLGKETLWQLPIL